LTKSGYRRILQFGFPFEVLTRDLRLIFTSNLVGSFGDGLYAYLLPVYMGESLGASDVEIGALYAVMSLTAASTLYLAGTLADRYDRKKIMIAGWVAWLPAPLIFAFAQNWLQMLPGMVLWGVWLGGPTGTAYIVSTADKSRLTLTFTVMSAAWSFGYIFSPALGGYLAGVTGMRVVFFLAFIFYSLATITLTFLRSQYVVSPTRDSQEERCSFFTLLKTKKLLSLSIFFASMMFIVMLFRPFIPKFLSDVYHYGDFEIGVFGSISFFSSAVLGILLGRLGDRRGKSYALAASMILCSLSLTILLLFGNFYILAIAFFLAGGSYMTWSLMSAVIGPLAPECIRARWISVPQTVSMFASFIAPYIGGVLYTFWQYYPFIVAIVITLFLALIATAKVYEK